MTKPFVVVAGTDFSENAARALRTAYDQALQHAPAELHVAHVSFAATAEPSLPLAAASGLTALPVLSLDELRAALVKYLDQQLAKVAGFPSSGVRVYAHVAIDTPSFALIRLASELEADLIVVGSHGLHGIARWLLGSVTDGVVRQATCPVLVVPPKPDTQPVPSIEPPCPRCVAARRASSGGELWCEQHRERHGRRHTYYQSDRAAAETNMPLVVR